MKIVMLGAPGAGKGTQADKIAENAWFQFVDDSMSRIKPCGTEFKMNTKLLSIGDGEITVEKDGKEEKLKCDYVVLSMGVRPNNALLDEIAKAGVETKAVLIGDADKGGTIGNATQSAFKAAMII